jgi:hypothetical protein
MARAITVRLTDPVTHKLIRDQEVTAVFYAPPKKPATNPADREHPDVTVELRWHPREHAYTGTLPAHLAPGRYWARIGSLASGHWSWKEISI